MGKKRNFDNADEEEEEYGGGGGRVKRAKNTNLHMLSLDELMKRRSELKVEENQASAVMTQKKKGHGTLWGSSDIRASHTQVLKAKYLYNEVEREIERRKASMGMSSGSKNKEAERRQEEVDDSQKAARAAMAAAQQEAAYAQFKKWDESDTGSSAFFSFDSMSPITGSGSSTSGTATSSKSAYGGTSSSSGNTSSSTSASAPPKPIHFGGSINLPGSTETGQNRLAGIGAFARGMIRMAAGNSAAVEQITTEAIKSITSMDTPAVVTSPHTLPAGRLVMPPKAATPAKAAGIVLPGKAAQPIYPTMMNVVPAGSEIPGLVGSVPVSVKAPSQALAPGSFSMPSFAAGAAMATNNPGVAAPSMTGLDPESVAANFIAAQKRLERAKAMAEMAGMPAPTMAMLSSGMLPGLPGSSAVATPASLSPAFVLPTASSNSGLPALYRR